MYIKFKIRSFIGIVFSFIFFTVVWLALQSLKLQLTVLIKNDWETKTVKSKIQSTEKYQNSKKNSHEHYIFFFIISLFAEKYNIKQLKYALFILEKLFISVVNIKNVFFIFSFVHMRMMNFLLNIERYTKISMKIEKN